MVFKWREAHTSVFLDQFRKYQCLWNYKIDSYKNRATRADAIKALIRDLDIDGVTEEDVKLKIKTIRTKYASELAKVKKSKASADTEEVYVPKLYWFQQANDFLNTVCHHRVSSSNRNIEDRTPPHSQTDNSLNVSSDNGRTQKVEVICNVEVEDCGSDDQSQAPSSGQSEAITSRETSTPPNTYRPQKSLKRSTEMPIYKTIKQSKCISNGNTADENEFDLFCKSLAVQLKKMPLARALLCQEKLQSVMVQERLASIMSEAKRSPNNSSDESESQTYHPANW